MCYCDSACSSDSFRKVSLTLQTVIASHIVDAVSMSAAAFVASQGTAVMFMLRACLRFHPSFLHHDTTMICDQCAG